MFIAIVILCSSLEAKSCELFFNPKEIYFKEETCISQLKLIEKAVAEYPIPVVKTGCIRIVGELA